MRRHVRHIVLLAMGLALGSARPGLGQPHAPAASGELQNLARDMQEGLLALAQEIIAVRGYNDNTRDAYRHAGLLARDVGGFRQATHGRHAPRVLAVGYDNNNTSWNQLWEKINRPDVATPSLLQATERLGAINGQIVQHLNRIAPGVIGAAPGGYGDRARDLAPDVDYRHSGYRGYTPPAPERPYGPGPVGPYQGGLDDPYSADAYLPPLGQNNYRSQPANPYPGGAPLTPENYGPPPVPVPYRFAPSPAPTGGQITALSEQLLGQADAFLQAFAPQVGTVPEGRQFLAEATALRDATARFREVALAGARPARLADEFGGITTNWQRLEARTARVSKGRVGPNIATVLQMGETIKQMGQLMSGPRGFADDEF